MTMHNDIMRMRKVGTLQLPAGRIIELTPRGLHLMLSDLKKPLNVGDTVILTITVQSSDGISTTTKMPVPVKPAPLSGQNGR